MIKNNERHKKQSNALKVNFHEEEPIDYASLVHDNIITSYQVDIENCILTMATKYNEKESAIIEFPGLLAHKFDYVILSNVIFGIYQESIDSFIEKHNDFLNNSIKYGFPLITVKNIDSLKSELEKRDYKIFIIESSFGLNGFVIASDINIGITNI